VWDLCDSRPLQGEGGGAVEADEKASNLCAMGLIVRAQSRGCLPRWIVAFRPELYGACSNAYSPHGGLYGGAPMALDLDNIAVARLGSDGAIGKLASLACENNKTSRFAS